MERDLNKWTRKMFLSLPRREWDETSSYDSIVILDNRTKHDSGYACMVIIGIEKGVPKEVCAEWCDDIEWIIPSPRLCETYPIGQFRTDCFLKSGAMHVWSHNAIFIVGIAVSSVTIELRRIDGT